MKIESYGFRITDICSQVPEITVTSGGDIRLHFKPLHESEAKQTSAFSAEEFDALIEALVEVRARIKQDNLDVSNANNSRPLTVIDRGGDEWVWRDDHNGYVLVMNDHDKGDCPGDCGGSLRWIEQNWGPLKPKP